MDSLYIFVVVSIFLLVGVGWYLGRRTAGKGIFEALISADQDTRLWIFTLFGLCLGIMTSLGAIGVILAYHIIDPVVISLVSTYNGIVLGATVTTSYNYWLGSSAGSKRKDDALATVAQNTNQGG